MDARSWTGFVIWSDEDEPFLVRRVTAELHLDEGGWLLSDARLFGSKIDIRFWWGEVKKVERLRYWGFLYLGEALRFTLAKTTVTANQRGLFAGAFTFGSPMRKRTAAQMVDLLESKGAKVECKTRFATIMA